MEFGYNEYYFFTFQVVGVMGQAMQAVSPRLIDTILSCAQAKHISLSNQKAAIQAFRLMDITNEVQLLHVHSCYCALCYIYIVESPAVLSWSE